MASPIGPDLRQSFWTALDDSPFLMVRLAGGDTGGQPMTAMLDPSAHGTIWFFMSRDNDLASGGEVRAEFAAKGHRLFAALTGTLEIEPDRAVFEKLWSNKVAAWFKGGKDDPALRLMRYAIAHAEVWEVDMSIGGLLHLFTGTLIPHEEAGHHAEGTV